MRWTSTSDRCQESGGYDEPLFGIPAAATATTAGSHKVGKPKPARFQNPKALAFFGAAPGEGEGGATLLSAKTKIFSFPELRAEEISGKYLYFTYFKSNSILYLISLAYFPYPEGGGKKKSV